MNAPVPDLYAISAAASFPSVGEFLARLAGALEGGLRLLQVRDKDLARRDRASLATECVRLCHGFGCQVLVNGDAEIARKAGADGVHLGSADLRGKRPAGLGLVGASCHDGGELESAFGEAGADFAVLSPVMPTDSHPGAGALGWDRFEELASGCPGPVYALGGLRVGDAGLAKSRGAAGVASMRDVWGLPMGGAA